MIKEAFVKALSSGGVVDKNELNRIRRELGLAPDTVIDTQLSKHSIKPLSRQQIRDIIDRNAASLGAAVQDGTIRTSDQLYASLSDKEKARRAGKREEAATARLENSDFDENRAITLFQTLIGGTADFQTEKNRTRLLGMAYQQAENVMKACKGNPSDTRECVLFFKTESGANIEMPTGLTEKKFLETIENTCMRLSFTGIPEKETRNARRDFLDLPSSERQDYFRALSNDAESRFKARTAIVALLQERGIDDYATLSIVNKIQISNLKDLAEMLLTKLKNASGDALRSSQFMRELASFVGNSPYVAPFAEKAFIPAFPSEEYNDNISRAIKTFNDKLPPGVRCLLEQLRADMHTRFGDAVPADKDLSLLANSTDVANVCNALKAEGKLATADNLREALADKVLDESVTNCIYKAAPQFLEKFGGGNPTQFTTFARKVCPDLVAELRTAQSPEEASAAIVRHSETLLRIAERMAPCRNNEDKVVDLYREALAKELGVSVDSEMVQHAETVHLGLAASSLTDKICRGELDLKTDAEIGDAFKKLAADHARERAGLIGNANMFCQSPLAVKTLKRHILALGKTNKFDFDKFKAESAKMKPLTEKVAQLIDSGASVDDICNAIGDVFQACKGKLTTYCTRRGSSTMSVQTITQAMASPCRFSPRTPYQDSWTRYRPSSNAKTSGRLTSKT